MKKLFTILLVFFYLSSKAQLLNDSLIAFYPFTGNALDSSGKGNNGVVTGATLTTDRFGKSNSAYLFNGTSNEIRITNAFKGKQPFTTNASVCYWINTNTAKTAAAVLTYHSACSNSANDLMTFYINNANGAHWLYNTIYWHSPLLSVDESTVTDSVWHFVCYTYNNDSAKLYVDGNLKMNSKVTPEPGFGFDKFTDLVIGNVSSNSCGYNFFFEGSIDDIRVYNRTLSQKEVSNLKENKLNVEKKLFTLINNGPVLFPNPGQDHLNISKINSAVTSIQLTDITGKSIQNIITSDVSETTIDLQYFSNGCYTVIFKNKEGQALFTEKLLINK